MLDELFWILLRPLIFFQTQWLSFFAGILWGYFLRKSGGTSRIQLLGLAARVEDLDGGLTAALVVLDGEHHGHSLADLDKSADLAGPRPLANLDLHPAANVVSSEVSPHNIEHVDGEWPVSR